MSRLPVRRTEQKVFSSALEMRSTASAARATGQIVRTRGQNVRCSGLSGCPRPASYWQVPAALGLCGLLGTQLSDGAAAQVIPVQATAHWAL